MRKLAIVATHPVQYNAPLFRRIAEREKLQIKVFYTRGKTEGPRYDPEFRKSFSWDIPLLEGYEYAFCKNAASHPDKKSFHSIKNPDLVQSIEAWNAEAVWVFGWNYQSHYRVMKYFSGRIPVLFRGDSTLLDSNSKIRDFFRHIFLKKIYKNIDYALYTGTQNKKYFQKTGLKASQLVFAPHAVDNERFSKNYQEYAEKAAKWKQDIGIPTEKIVVLFAGKLISKKQPHLMIRAAEELPDIHWVIAGNGELENTLKQKANNRKNITFLPFQNQQDMPVLYRLGDLFVFPSAGPNETWGLAVNEAMASGRPVLVSDNSGCAVDLVKPGLNGEIFNARDEADFLAKLKNLTRSKADLMTKSLYSWEIIREWNYDKVARAVENILIS